MCGYFSASPVQHLSESLPKLRMSPSRRCRRTCSLLGEALAICGYAASALGNEVRDFTDITRRPAESVSSVPPADSDDQVRLHDGLLACREPMGKFAQGPKKILDWWSSWEVLVSTVNDPLQALLTEIVKPVAKDKRHAIEPLLARCKQAKDNLQATRDDSMRLATIGHSLYSMCVGMAGDWNDHWSATHGILGRSTTARSLCWSVWCGLRGRHTSSRPRWTTVTTPCTS